MFRLVGPSTGLLICQLVIWLVVCSVGESFHLSVGELISRPVSWFVSWLAGA